MTYHYSRPHSVYAQSTQSQAQSSPNGRPFSVVGYEGIPPQSSQSSFRVIRRRQQRKSVRSNVLNPTLDNFYNTLRRTEADLNVKSAKSWIQEYESYRRQVINDEKSSIENTRPVSFYDPTFVSSPVEFHRYSMI